jgi:hypothetical protein
MPLLCFFRFVPLGCGVALLGGIAPPVTLLGQLLLNQSP